MYEPEELVMRVRAGTPISHLRQVLAEKSQQLVFEPPQYAALFGDSTSEDTIGGIVACNLSGPRRILSGSVRDAVLGIEGVNGRGEIFKGGGRTVKNVTGYDIPRLLTGSFGVLAVITSITLKIHPAPAREATLLLTGLSDAAAIQVLSGALKMPLEISAAVHLSGRLSETTTAVRLEGFSESVAARERELRKYLATKGPVTSMAGDESAAFWRRQRDLSDFASDPAACVWRLLLPASKAARVVAAISGEVLYDWGGSQVFIKTSACSAHKARPIASGAWLEKQVAARACSRPQRPCAWTSAHSSPDPGRIRSSPSASAGASIPTASSIPASWPQEVTEQPDVKTSIPEAALADPDIALSNDIIRDCVHCGICLSHCPTYQVRHDENDSPRGRILLMRHMYEQGGSPMQRP